MKRKDIISEFRSRLTTTLSEPQIDHHEASNIQRELDLLDQFSESKTFQTIETFTEYLHSNRGKLIIISTASGSDIELTVDSISFENKDPEPTIKNHWGLYLTPPHGERIWSGKKTAIIKSVKITKHLNEPLYLLSGKYGYGIIQLGDPKAISLSDFSRFSQKHQITDTERRKWWPNATTLYMYPVRIIRRWSPPKEWQVQKGAQNFVKDVKFEDQAYQVAKFIFQERGEDAKKEDETREETLKKEMERFGDWYKIHAKKGRNYRYVVQHHIRGDSVHTDLRLEVNDHLVGFTLDTPGAVKDIEKDKFLKPQKESKILTQLKLIQPKAWLTVKGHIPPGGIGATKNKEAEFRINSTGRIKFGVQKHDFHEIFLFPDKKWSQDSTVKGRWIISLIPKPPQYERAGSGNKIWLTFKPADQRPYTESQSYDASVEKARKEKGYLVWQHPEKGELETSVDFRENKKDSWTYK